MQAGFDPDVPGRWQWTWRSSDDSESAEAAAIAFCVEQTLTEGCGACCPSFQDSLRVAQETQALEPGANRLQVRCDPGETLLIGNCMLDAPEASAMDGLTMFRYGFPPGAPDTWGCSWNNPSGVAVTGIATALCLVE